MDSEIVPDLEAFCFHYRNKSKLVDILESRSKKEAEFYYRNTKKLLDYMCKNYTYLGRLKYYIGNLKYVTIDLRDILNEGKVIPIGSKRKPVLKLVQ